jgi:hypothetical protein
MPWVASFCDAQNDFIVTRVSTAFVLQGNTRCIIERTAEEETEEVTTNVLKSFCLQAK